MKGEKTALNASSRPQKTSALTESNVHSLLTPAAIILYETTTGEFGFQNFKPSTERPITRSPSLFTLSILRILLRESYNLIRCTETNKNIGRERRIYRNLRSQSSKIYNPNVSLPLPPPFHFAPC